MTQGTHISIGELLEELREEFPDVTISKVRFLESQGLINPERTPSGYRKFFAPDVALLRWILLQQRDNFLPLKEIRRRIEDGEAPHAEPDHTSALGPHDGVVEPAATPNHDVAALTSPSDASTPSHANKPSERSTPTEARESGRTSTPNTAAAAVVAPAASSDTPVLMNTGRPAHSVFDQDDTATYAADEVCARVGISPESLAELERYGLLSTRSIAGTAYYDSDALAVAELAQEFARHGVEPRHLRLHRLAVDREVGFLEQRVATLVRQRNPEARREARGVVESLVELGSELHFHVLRSLMRAYRDRL